MKIGGVEVREWEYVCPEGPVYVAFIKTSDVPEEHKDEFYDWLGCCTAPMIPGHNDAIYSWDWERWYNMKTKGIPTMWD